MKADPIYPGESWTIASSPEAAGWSGAGLEAAYAFAAAIGTGAIVIVQDGVIASEWGAVNHVSGIASMRKSLLSGLIGIHVAEGTIDLRSTLAELGIDDCEPGLTVQEKQATIADLLTSRSGVYHAAADQGPSTAPERGCHLPGQYWFYNNWDFNVLGVVVQQLTGIPLAHDFDERIAAPCRCRTSSAITSISRLRRTRSIRPTRSACRHATWQGWGYCSNAMADGGIGN